MNLDGINQKDLNELERLTRELIAQMRKAKLTNEPLVDALAAFERELSDLRRERFDASNPGYKGY
ncbi:MAG: hypothetical protein IAE80_26945 [Anaerolinea sp.]|nr:hypothetical protein [Anaerolinea sp.]